MGQSFGGGVHSVVKNGVYELVRAPDDYPGKRYRGRYVYEHLLVWWQTTGSLVPNGFVVRHENGQKRDNRPSNLKLRSLSASRYDLEDALRPFITVSCTFCGGAFEVAAKAHRARVKSKGWSGRWFCSRSHQVSHWHQERGY
jgi:hypothetical protein